MTNQKMTPSVVVELSEELLRLNSVQLEQQMNGYFRDLSFRCFVKEKQWEDKKKIRGKDTGIGVK